MSSLQISLFLRTMSATTQFLAILEMLSRRVGIIHHCSLTWYLAQRLKTWTSCPKLATLNSLLNGTILLCPQSSHDNVWVGVFGWGKMLQISFSMGIKVVGL